MHPYRVTIKPAVARVFSQAVPAGHPLHRSAVLLRASLWIRVVRPVERLGVMRSAAKNGSRRGAKSDASRQNAMSYLGGGAPASCSRLLRSRSVRSSGGGSDKEAVSPSALALSPGRDRRCSPRVLLAGISQSEWAKRHPHDLPICRPPCARQPAISMLAAQTIPRGQSFE